MKAIVIGKPSSAAAATAAAALVPAGAKPSGPKIKVGGPPRLSANAASKKVDAIHAFVPVSIYVDCDMLCDVCLWSPMHSLGFMLCHCTHAVNISLSKSLIIF